MKHKINLRQEIKKNTKTQIKISYILYHGDGFKAQLIDVIFIFKQSL